MNDNDLIKINTNLRNEINNYKNILEKYDEKTITLKEINAQLVFRLDEQINMNETIKKELREVNSKKFLLAKSNHELMNKLDEQVRLNEEFSRINTILCEKLIIITKNKIKEEKQEFLLEKQQIKIEKLESILNEQDIDDKNMCKKIIKIKNDLLEN